MRENSEVARSERWECCEVTFIYLINYFKSIIYT